MDVQFFRLGLSVSGLHVWNPVTDDSILSVEQVQVPISIFPLGIGELKLKNQNVTLHIGPDGKLREFRNVPAPKKKGSPYADFLERSVGSK